MVFTNGTMLIVLQRQGRTFKVWRLGVIVLGDAENFGSDLNVKNGMQITAQIHEQNRHQHYH